MFTYSIILPVKIIEPIAHIDEAVMRCTSFDPLGKPKNATAVLCKSLAAKDVLADYEKCLNTYARKNDIPKIKYNNVTVTIGLYLLQKNNLYRTIDTMLPLIKEAVYGYIGLNPQAIITEHCYKRFLDNGHCRGLDEYIYFKIQNESKDFKELLIKESEIVDLVGVNDG